MWRTKALKDEAKEYWNVSSEILFLNKEENIKRNIHN